MSCREFTCYDNLLNHERCGNRAEYNPKCGDNHAEGRLQRVERCRWVNEPEGRVSHEIQNPLRDERGDRPAERPEQHDHHVHQVGTVDGTQRPNRHEPDERRGESVGTEKNELLNDVRPEQEQRSKLPDEPENAGDQQFDCERI